MSEAESLLAEMVSLAERLARVPAGAEKISGTLVAQLRSQLSEIADVCRKATRMLEDRCSHSDSQGNPTVVFDRDAVDPTANAWMCTSCGWPVGHRSMSTEDVAALVLRQASPKPDA